MVHRYTMTFGWWFLDRISLAIEILFAFAKCHGGNKRRDKDADLFNPFDDERTFVRQDTSSVVVSRHRVCFNRRNVDVVSLALWRTIKGGDNLALLCLTAPQLSRLFLSLSRSFYHHATSQAEGFFVSPWLWLLREIFHAAEFSFRSFFFRARTSSLFIRSYLVFDFVTSVDNLALFLSPRLYNKSDMRLYGWESQYFKTYFCKIFRTIFKEFIRENYVQLREEKTM